MYIVLWMEEEFAGNRKRWRFADETQAGSLKPFMERHYPNFKEGK